MARYTHELSSLGESYAALLGVAELKARITELERQNTDLQARNTELVERVRVQGKALKNSCCPSCGYRYEVKIWIKGLDGELEI